MKGCPWCETLPVRDLTASPAKEDQFPDRQRPWLKCPNGHAQLKGPPRLIVTEKDWAALEARWNTRK